jgi:hypothetical protein
MRRQAEVQMCREGSDADVEVVHNHVEMELVFPDIRRTYQIYH